MVDSQILLSIIIPAFNAENYIEKCINRIVPLLDCDVECIVVDDGSTDNTLKLLRNISNNIVNINIISQNNTGVSGARNNALKKANGKYICYIDIDDVIDTGTLKKVIEYLRNNVSEELVVFPHYEGNESKGFILKEQILHEGKNTDLMELYKATFRQKLNEPWKKIFRADIYSTMTWSFLQICIWVRTYVCLWIICNTFIVSHISIFPTIITIKMMTAHLQ